MGVITSIVIVGWLPDQLANGQHGHWRTRQKKLEAAQVMVWTAAKHAGLTPVTGKARVHVELVFGTNRRRDTDNLYSRCKGLLDGLVKGGWLKDDSTEWLDLKVTAVVERGVKETRITLQPAPLTALMYDRIYRSEEEWDTAADLKPKSGVQPNRPVVSGIPIDTPQKD